MNEEDTASSPGPVPDRHAPGHRSPEHLASLTSEELIEVFSGLEAPAMSEMNGLFPATGSYARQPLRDQRVPKKLVTLVGRATLTPWRGRWIGKVYNGGTPGTDTGRGYNQFRRGESVTRCIAFTTCVGPSYLDGGRSFRMHYSAFHSLWGDVIELVDEVRRIESGRYLLLGMAGWCRPDPAAPSFVELGTSTEPYAGDRGRARRYHAPV